MNPDAIEGIEESRYDNILLIYGGVSIFKSLINFIISYFYIVSRKFRVGTEIAILMNYQTLLINTFNVH